MTRTTVLFAAALMTAVSAGATSMKPSAPDRMASPADKQKMQACQDRAVAQNVPMSERAKFVMDCMAAAAK